jgi:hypothetical protein
MLKAGMPLKTKFHDAAKRRRAAEFLPKAARILELKRAGLTRRQTMEVFSVNISTVARVYRNEAQLEKEIADVGIQPAKLPFLGSAEI